MTTVSESAAVREHQRPSDADLAGTYWLHGDAWEAPDGTLRYRCACCDLFLPGEHLKEHPRREHLIRMRSTERVFLNLSSRRPLMRPDPDDNLVQQALVAERLRGPQPEPVRVSWLPAALAAHERWAEELRAKAPTSTAGT